MFLDPSARLFVPERPCSDLIAEQAYVIVLLRLVVDQHGRLMYGEVVDVAGRSWGRFGGWYGLARKLQSYLTSQAPAGASNAR